MSLDQQNSKSSSGTRFYFGAHIDVHVYIYRVSKCQCGIYLYRDVWQKYWFLCLFNYYVPQSKLVEVALCSTGVQFQYQPVRHLSWLRPFVAFFISSRNIQGRYLYVATTICYDSTVVVPPLTL
jgi:hypothetical protein